MWTGDKSPVTNFGAAKEVKNCRLVILLPADLRVEITAKSKRNGGSHIVANGFAVWNVWESGLCSYQPTPKVDAWQYARITTSPQMFYDRMLCTGIFFIIFAQI